MAQTKTLKAPNGKEYIIASLTVGQVEDYVLTGDGSTPFQKRVIENPRAVVLCGLNNAVTSESNLHDVAAVRDLDWKTFKYLQEEILEFSGFPKQVEGTPGEAAPVVH